MAPSHRMERTAPRKSRALAAVALAAALVLAGGTAAFAYWSAQGSGTSAATTGTSTSFTITSVTPAGALMPGGASETVAFTVHNPGTATQQLSGLAVTVASAGGVAWNTTPGCSADDFALGTPVFTAGEIAGSGQLSGTVSISMLDRGVSQDACQGVTVPLYFVAR